MELMHAPGHAPKPLTGSQPTSLYDKYKRRAQRLLLIAWQKLRNPHFVLRTPDSYPASFHQPSTPSARPPFSTRFLALPVPFLPPPSPSVRRRPPFEEKVGCRRRRRRRRSTRRCRCRRADTSDSSPPTDNLLRLRPSQPFPFRKISRAHVSSDGYRLLALGMCCRMVRLVVV